MDGQRCLRGWVLCRLCTCLHIASLSSRRVSVPPVLCHHHRASSCGVLKVLSLSGTSRWARSRLTGASSVASSRGLIPWPWRSGARREPPWGRTARRGGGLSGAAEQCATLSVSVSLTCCALSFVAHPAWRARNLTVPPSHNATFVPTNDSAYSNASATVGERVLPSAPPRPPPGAPRVCSPM